MLHVFITSLFWIPHGLAKVATFLHSQKLYYLQKQNKWANPIKELCAKIIKNMFLVRSIYWTKVAEALEPNFLGSNLI